jgi:hypothetical protein
MKKMITTLISIMLFWSLAAPPSNSGMIFVAEVFRPYKTIIHAIGATETNHDTLAINPKEQAYGYFQVRQIRLDDYYQRTGIRYELSDMLNYQKAEAVFLHYACKFRYDDYKGIAYDWNKSVTNRYWNKVRGYLN